LTNRSRVWRLRWRVACISASAATMRDSTRNTTASIHAAIAGRKNIQCSLVEYSTLSPGCRTSSI
jgi:hypothetical protein